MTELKIGKLQLDDAFIVEQKNFFNQHGMRVEHREIFYVDKDATEHTTGHVEFVGHGGLPAMDENGNPETIPFEFGIAAKDLREAFRKFRVACNLKGEQLKKEIREEQAKLKKDEPIIHLK